MHSPAAPPISSARGLGSDLDDSWVGRIWLLIRQRSVSGRSWTPQHLAEIADWDLSTREVGECRIRAFAAQLAGLQQWAETLLRRYGG
jgi:hypothetical protein